MLPEEIEIDTPVITALDVYKPAKREQVMAEILKIVEDPANRHKVPGYPESERLYLADMLATGLRVIFRTDEHGRVIELVDFFRPWRVPETATNETQSSSAQ